MADPDTLILGIESSCDETAVAILHDGREILAHKLASQSDLHRRFGGVVPEVACRAHMEVFLPLASEALAEAQVEAEQIDAIAVTNRPGLVGALLVGVAAAKGLALAWDKPLVGVDHIEAHISAARLVNPGISFPFVALVVSGGHTTLYLVRSPGEYEEVARTRDDAAGEAFDKAASALGLPYPGGPSIQRAAELGDDTAYDWRRACLPGDGLDLSFSGLKTAVLYAARGQARGRRDPLLLDEQGIADAAASFQTAIAHALVTRTMQVAKREAVDWVAIGGGVAANQRLRADLVEAADEAGVHLALPPMHLSTDNAIMVAARGHEVLITHGASGLEMPVRARAFPEGLTA
jgi:N6-L-threonylcarbamoyladenine synthase